MAQKIFVSGTGQNCGKTTVSLALLHMARKSGRRIGFLKPVGPKPATLRGRDVDKDVALVAQVYHLEHDLGLMSPVVLHSATTRQVLDGTIRAEALQDSIVLAAEQLSRHCDLLVIEGAGHSGVGAAIGLNNARVAKLLGAPVLLVTGGGVGSVIDAVVMNLALYRAEGADVRLVLANKLQASKRERTLGYLQRAFQLEDFPVAASFNYSPILANPTLNRIARILGLELQGNRSEGTRIVHHLQLGAASAQRVADLLQESTLLLVTASRDELLVMLANLYQLPDYKSKIAGLVIPGTSPVSKITQQILDGSDIPYLRTHRTTAEVFTKISEDVTKINAEDTHKISLIQALAESGEEIDWAMIDRLFAPAAGS